MCSVVPYMSWLTVPILRYGAFALAAFAGIAVLYAYDPSTSGLYPQCPFHFLTGLHCPGCGTLRALHQASTGDIVAAFGLNPLMMSSVPFVGYALLSGIRRDLTGRSLPTVFIPSFWIWLLLGVVISFWVLRNIPVYPFSVLAP